MNSGSNGESDALFYFPGTPQRGVKVTRYARGQVVYSAFYWEDKDCFEVRAQEYREIPWCWLVARFESLKEGDGKGAEDAIRAFEQAFGFSKDLILAEGAGDFDGVARFEALHTQFIAGPGAPKVSSFGVSPIPKRSCTE